MRTFNKQTKINTNSPCNTHLRAFEHGGRKVDGVVGLVRGPVTGGQHLYAELQLAQTLRWEEKSERKWSEKGNYK